MVGISSSSLAAGGGSNCRCSRCVQLRLRVAPWGYTEAQSTVESTEDDKMDLEKGKVLEKIH